jgi:hypothetical protein
MLVNGDFLRVGKEERGTHDPDDRLDEDKEGHSSPLLNISKKLISYKNIIK